jgi:aspartate kinase
MVHTLFRPFAEANIVVDMIVQNVARHGRTEVSFTVASGDLPEALRVAEGAARSIGASGVSHDPEVSKVSIVGLGMKVHTGVARAMFDALGDAGVNIQMITTSEIKISVLVDRSEGVKALREVHKAFELGRARLDEVKEFRPQRRGIIPVPALGENGHGIDLPGMEDVVVSGIALEENQARVTVLEVPDQPGYAARVFAHIARAEINVDMIVQNVRSESGDTRLSITVPRADADAAAKAAAEATGSADLVLVEPNMAKLSVDGVGMRTHTGVATRMFGALADSGINIALISTSEVRVNVLTDLDRGQEGLARLEEAFADHRRGERNAG